MRNQKSCKKLKDAYLSLLPQNGAEKIRVASLLEAAEVSKATFYTYYEDLDHLALDVIDSLLQDLDGILEDNNQKTPHTTSDFLIVCQWITDRRACLSAFQRSKYFRYLKKSLLDYLSKIIHYYRKALGGDMEAGKDMARFLAHAFLGDVFEALEEEDEKRIPEVAKLLETAAKQIALAESGEKKQFFPFRNTGRRCPY